MCVFMVLDSLRPTTPGDRPPASTASEVYLQMHCKGTTFLVRIQISPLQLARFLAQNRPILARSNLRCSKP